MSDNRKPSASRIDAATEKIPSINLSGLWFSPTAARKAKKATAKAKNVAKATPAAKPKAPAKPVAKPKAPAKPAAKPKAPAKPAAKPKAPAKPVAKPKAPAKPAAKPKAPAKPAAKPKAPAKPAAKPKAPAKPASKETKAAPGKKTSPVQKAAPPNVPAPEKTKSKVNTISSGASAAKATGAKSPETSKIEPKPFNPDDVPDFGDDLDMPPPPDDTPFTDEELARFRENLRELRAKLSGKAASLQSQSLHRYDEVNNAEDGTDAMTRNTELKKAALDEDQIKQIDAALVALGNGTYGFCQNCGRKIGTKRLLAIPFAKFCIQCQSDMEDEAARRGPAVDPDTATYED